MRIEWLPDALRDLESQLDYIAERSPRAAVRMDGVIERSVSRLEDFPESAPRGRMPGTRELVVSGTPFVVVYRVAGDSVEIIRLLHAAQAWPRES